MERSQKAHSGYDRGVVVCVLGCRSGSAALERRARAGARAFFERSADLVVACGGRAWDGVVEADAIARVLEKEGVPRRAIVRERCSLDTWENAGFAASMLRRRARTEVLVVTCAWHLPRAQRLFDAAGLRAEGLGVPRPETSPLVARYLAVREAVSAWKDLRRPARRFEPEAQA